MTAAHRSLAKHKARRFGIWPGTTLFLVMTFGLGIVTLLAVVVWLAFYDGVPGDPGGTYTFKHYAQVISEPHTYVVLINTLWFSLSSLFVAVLFGLPPAWIVERTDLPAKTLVLTMMTIGLLIPGFADAMGWVFLLHPRIGLINGGLMELFGLTEAPFNIGTILGMGWVQGLNLAPVVFIMTAAVFRAMDPALEEAAHMSGANLRSTLRRITLAVSWSGIAAAIIYVFTIGFAAFDVPAIIGWGNRIFTFSTYVVLLVSPEHGLPRYGPAAALSTFFIIFAGLLSWWYNTIQARAQRFAVITGKAYRPRVIALNKWVYLAWGFIALYFCLSKVFPIIVLLWASLLPFFQLPSARAFSTMSTHHYESLPWALVWSALTNTSLLMVLTPTIVIVVSLAFSWVTLRTRLRGRGVVDFIAFLPHAVPNIVFGIGALLFVLFVVQPILPLYGTIWVVLIIFVIARLSYGTRMTNSGLIQIHRELEESARVGGANTDEVLRRVVIPLLAPTIIYAWLWIALLTYRELTLAVVLTARDNITAPVLIWNFWTGGGLGPAAALAIVLMLLVVPFIVLYWLLLRGRRTTVL